jgi:hypothetical protein
MRDIFEAVSKRVGPDQFEFQGKKGHWRTVKGNELFFPDDGSSPMGMPGAMKAASKKSAKAPTGAGGGGAKYFDPQKSTLAASIRLSRKVSGAEAKQAASELADLFHQAAGKLAADRDLLPDPNADDDEATEAQWAHEKRLSDEAAKLRTAWMKKWGKKTGVSDDDMEDEWLSVHERAVLDRKH